MIAHLKKESELVDFQAESKDDWVRDDTQERLWLCVCDERRYGIIWKRSAVAKYQNQ